MSIGSAAADSVSAPASFAGEEPADGHEDASLRAYSRDLRAQAVHLRKASADLRAACKHLVGGAQQLTDESVAGKRLADAQERRARGAVARALGRD